MEIKDWIALVLNILTIIIMIWLDLRHDNKRK
nr:MAG TPA: chitin synthase regulator [Caudoviricetes sp.]